MQSTLPEKYVKQADHVEAGRLIRKLRRKHGVSLRTLAKRMGFSAPFISDLERGRRNWTPETFNDAAKAITKTAKNGNGK